MLLSLLCQVSSTSLGAVTTPTIDDEKSAVNTWKAHHLFKRDASLPLPLQQQQQQGGQCRVKCEPWECRFVSSQRARAQRCRPIYLLSLCRLDDNTGSAAMLTEARGRQTVYEQSTNATHYALTMDTTRLDLPQMRFINYTVVYISLYIGESSLINNRLSNLGIMSRVWVIFSNKY